METTGTIENNFMAQHFLVLNYALSNQYWVLCN